MVEVMYGHESGPGVFPLEKCSGAALALSAHQAVCGKIRAVPSSRLQYPVADGRVGLSLPVSPAHLSSDDSVN